MRPKFLSLLLLAALLPTLTQAAAPREYDRTYLEGRMQKFRNMRSTGFTMAGIGAVALIGGIVLASNGEWEEQQSMNGGTNYNAQDASAGFGLLGIVLGVPLTLGGVILGSIGNSKVDKYEAMLQGMSLDLQLGDRKGARLAYRF